MCHPLRPDVVWRPRLTEKLLAGMNQPGSFTLEVLRG